MSNDLIKNPQAREYLNHLGDTLGGFVNAMNKRTTQYIGQIEVAESMVSDQIEREGLQIFRRKAQQTKENLAELSPATVTLDQLITFQLSVGGYGDLCRFLPPPGYKV